MTKFDLKSKAVRAGEIALRPTYEWKVMVMKLKARLRSYKHDLESERSFVAPFGWEYRKGIGGVIYLWPKKHDPPIHTTETIFEIIHLNKN